jgi:hypothetical protein
MRWGWMRRDLRFLVETLMPGYRDREQAVDLLASDEPMIERMLDDERLFGRLMDDEHMLVAVSPWLFFTVLLRRARGDLERESFTIERRDRQKVVLFDAGQAGELLARDTILDYLAGLLSSFTRVESRTVHYRAHQGFWRRYRTSELDVDGMVRYAQLVEAPFRFEPYKRVADVCLFLSGMFPEYIDAQHRYPASRQARPASRGRVCVSLEDHEAHGRAFYALAAEHEMAHKEGLEGVLATLAEHFILAEKPLRLIANRYLQFARHRLFDV